MSTINFYRVRDKYGCFSNFAQLPIWLKNVLWPSSEHYFQAQKFAGTPYEVMIRNLKTPKQAADAGRNRDLPLRADWEEVKDGIMFDAVEAKFSQHKDIRQILLDTYPHKLVEHTKNDFYWGDGGNGSGLNKLGQILMVVRNTIVENPYQGI